MVPDVRRRISIVALCLAWLCANGAVWNVVQVVGWAKMIRDYSRVMPVARAVEITFNGSAPCQFCHISQAAEDAARDQLPRDAALGGGLEKLLLVADSVPVVVLTAPAATWPGVVDDSGRTRTDEVPVTPPRV
jgi:hypothetical protein